MIVEDNDENLNLVVIVSVEEAKASGLWGKMRSLQEKSRLASVELSAEMFGCRRAD